MHPPPRWAGSRAAASLRRRWAERRGARSGRGSSRCRHPRRTGPIGRLPRGRQAPSGPLPLESRAHNPRPAAPIPGPGGDVGRLTGRGRPGTWSTIPSSTVPNLRILPMATEAVPAGPSLSSVPPSHRFANRELSGLDVNARVLPLAEDNARPLLERVRFLAIFSNNLDEFFQIRVAGLKEQLSVGLATTSPDGMTAREQLDEISGRVRLLMKRQHQIWAKSVRPRLAAAGISVVDWEDLASD